MKRLPSKGFNKTARCDPKKVTIKDVEKLELRVGTITGVQKHPKLDEFIILVDLGVADRPLQVVADLPGQTIARLMGRQVVVVVNICPDLVEGIESQGLLLVTTSEGLPVLIQPAVRTHPGVKVYGVMDSVASKLSNIGE